MGSELLIFSCTHFIGVATISYSYYKLYFQQISTHGCVIHVQNVVNNYFILHLNNCILKKKFILSVKIFIIYIAMKYINLEKP